MKKQISLSIDADELKKFKIFCIERNISVSEAVRQLMEMARLNNKIDYIYDGEIE